jgi:hypothetical protein
MVGDPNRVSDPAKPGVRTTEFWIALAATAACAVSAVYATQPWAQAVGAVGAALVASGYGLQRSAVKRAASQQQQPKP